MWERLSLGLNVLFTAWVRGVEHGRYQVVERKIERRLMIGISCPSLESVDLREEDRALAKAIACLRVAVRRYNDLNDRGVTLPDREAFEIARALLSSRHRPRTRVQQGIQRLRVRHLRAKGDDAWFREAGRGRLELARESGDKWRVPTVVRLHAYRISAFANIAHDLGGISSATGPTPARPYLAAYVGCYSCLRKPIWELGTQARPAYALTI